MFSWLLFNIIILAGFQGDYKILFFTIVANLVAYLELRIRSDSVETENKRVVDSVKKLTTRKYRKDL